MKKRGKEIDYEAKTVLLAGRRYIVYRNRQEAERDAADRASMSPRWNANSPKATRRSLATPAFGATSKRSASSTLRSIPTFGRALRRQRIDSIR
jgi:hypothetical protein